jgi:hypothetical protein
MLDKMEFPLVLKGERVGNDTWRFARHDIFYWMSQHLPMRVCQFFFDRSRSFRVWWGIDYTPLPRTPYARAELRVQKFYAQDDIEHTRKLAEKVGIHPAIIADSLGDEWSPYHEFRKRTDPPPYGLGLDDEESLCTCTLACIPQGISENQICKMSNDADDFRQRVKEAQAALEDGSDEAILAYLKKHEDYDEDFEDYGGSDESVKCAYPPCLHRLRRSSFGGPQWCSQGHRALSEKKPDPEPAFGPDEDDSHRLSGFRGYMS